MRRQGVQLDSMFHTVSIQAPVSTPAPSAKTTGEFAGGAYRWLIVFCGLVVLTCAVHAGTLTLSPAAWQDEIQIVDYGRTLFAGSDQSYGVNWSARARPIGLLSYLGCLFQETAYRLASNSMAGPRLMGILSGALAGCTMYGWLRGCRIRPWVAAVASLVFLWDPLFVGGYKGARVDALCMSFMFLALWCVRRSSQSSRGVSLLCAGGFFVALSGLTWSSAILLMPLLVYELFNSSHDTAEHGSTSTIIQDFVRRSAIVGASAAVAIVLLLIPMASQIDAMIADLGGGVNHLTRAGASAPLVNAMEVFRLFRPSPLLPVCALLGIAVFGPRSWAVPFAAAFCGVILTVPYWHRIVYLIPYLAYGLALALNRGIDSRAYRSWPIRGLAAGSIAALAFSGATSLVARPTVVCQEREQRDPRLAERFIDELTVVESPRVLLRSWSLYYAIRSRGWRFWGPYDLTPDAEIANLPDYHYVIHDLKAGLYPRLEVTDPWARSGLLEESLQRHGFTKKVVYLTDDTSGPPGKPHPYGPYVVYTNPGIAGGDPANSP